MRPAFQAISPLRTVLAVGTVWTACLLTGGCTKSHTLETGYTYRPLNASPTVIRGYYAGRFTPEARAAAMEREQELQRRRPTPGY